MESIQTIVIGQQEVHIEDIVHIARREHCLILDSSPAFVEHIQAGALFLERLLKTDGVIYGVTTGYGDSCTTHVPLHQVDDLPRQLYTFHGCGMGAIFDPEATRAILAARLVSLTKGFSGVRYALLEQIESFLQHDILPLIPEEGSVGASGDLTPLSYVAAALAGERNVHFDGEIKPTQEVLAKLELAPLPLKPKEGLAIMNGTAVMTALACIAFKRAEYLAQVATRITALTSIAMQGNAFHFDEVLFSAKPHPGQGRIANRLRDDLNYQPKNQHQYARLQDRYSLRCAPHVIGVLQDSLPWLRQFIENELNSANDNPIIDPIGEQVLHGGHFYGGHIAFAMDSLKTAVANIADLMDRQLACIADPKMNQGLPANLSGASSERRPLNHGFKAVQIAVSAWTAEALKNTLPASIFSRSTECHNQDKVSMGTISARDCLRVLQLTEQVASACLLASIQAVELRCKQLGTPAHDLPPALQQTMADIREFSPFLSEDRALERELPDLTSRIQQRSLRFYED
ncbi:Histidine ammonia-lyase, predicted methylene imidazolone (MIO) cofactor [gamma proteobacterium HdN1]|nr:Histidine ammonia-lyase, predicted methylene imidazolone (MIO) cofactor [gamma proteobacterium HdN1]